MAAKRVRTAPKIGYSALGPHRAMSLPAKAPGCRCWFKSGARNDLPASVPEPLSHIGGPQRSLFASLPRAKLSMVYPPLARLVGGLVLRSPKCQHENPASMESVFCFAGKEMDE